ncbi:hypothetical protein M0802_001738 [Mischocyttarus mexicanus]|nr:hypothetical protein M0802_001738 [Mischocyttarus mexicanus]
MRKGAHCFIDRLILIGAYFSKIVLDCATMIGYYLRKFKYDYTKEGKEPFQKLFALGKYAYAAAALTASYDLCVARQPLNVYAGFIQGGRHFLVWLGASSTFTLTVLLLTNIRQKDTPLNYFLGTCAAGSFVYSLIQHGGFVGFVTLWASIGAAVYKYQLLEGYVPRLERPRYSHTQFSFDFDKTPDVRYTKLE